MKQSVVLVGFMAAGKSRIGGLLAQRLGLPFADSDVAIEEAEGCTIAEIFRQRGENAFRDLERELIGRLVAGPPQVIALGGGAFLDERARTLLNERARTVWLDTPFDLLAERITRSSHRPLARNRPVGELRALWYQRRPSYAQAHIRIDTSDAKPERIVTAIIEAVR